MNGGVPRNSIVAKESIAGPLWSKYCMTTLYTVSVRHSPFMTTVFALQKSWVFIYLKIKTTVSNLSTLFKLKNLVSAWRMFEFH